MALTQPANPVSTFLFPLVIVLPGVAVLAVAVLLNWGR